MGTRSQEGASQLLDAWVLALDELQAEADRVRAGDSDPRQQVAVLHVLEQRAHTAFAAYRTRLLED